MDLIEDGSLSLDEPVTKYIPEFGSLNVAINKDGTPLGKIKNKNIDCNFTLVKPDSIMTLRHLINHQAGFYYATTGIRCIDSMFVSKKISYSFIQVKKREEYVISIQL